MAFNFIIQKQIRKFLQNKYQISVYLTVKTNEVARSLTPLVHI
jgi:hypothetical protein